MENLQPVIKFYQKRSFGEKMSAAVDFAKGNLKLLLKLCVYLLLPLSFIQGIFMNSYLNGITNFSQMAATGGNPATEIMNFLAPMLGNILFILIFSILANALLVSITFTTLQRYNEEGTLKGITFIDLKDGIIRNAKKALGITLLLALIGIGYYLILAAFIFISPFTLFITIPGLVLLFIPMTLVLPVHIFEGTPVSESIGKGFKLGMKTWGGLFLLLVIASILAGILQSVGGIPWYVIFMVKTVLNATNQAIETVNSFGYSIAQYLTGVIMLFFSYVSYILVYLCIAYHYSSASEATEATSVNEDLANFEQLKDNE